MPSRLEHEPLARRDFLGLAGVWAAAVAVVGSIVGMMRLPKPSVLPEAGSRFRIGRPDDFPAGSERAIPDRRVLVRADARGVAVISMVCTHLGCIVSKTDKGFSCPCHGSAFSQDGRVLAGPAPRGLRWLEVAQAVDGRLVVDALQEVEPDTFFKV